MIALLLTLFALGPPSAALAASSAGDDQYQDPFGTTSTQSSGASTTAQAPDGLTQTADIQPPDESATATTPTTAPQTGSSEESGSDSGSPATAGDSTELPNTGSDPRLLALAGLALLLAGIGLRLRLADERF